MQTVAALSNVLELAIARSLPISVKGVLAYRGRILLVKQPNGLWELPGGKPDDDEDPEDTLLREFEEETGLKIQPAGLIDRWIRRKKNGRRRLVLHYHCIARFSPDDIELSDEHVDFGLFNNNEIADLDMLDGYKRSLRKLPAGLASA